MAPELLHNKQTTIHMAENGGHNIIDWAASLEHIASVSVV
jgi:hypothetical protein